ncbi:hypothetical protein FKP32DRAFT_1677863 [Trametes sanguinea]|nr:hypothetical protein FKP32DRAFT_1677863 [Trametes sanguinea]
MPQSLSAEEWSPAEWKRSSGTPEDDTSRNSDSGSTEGSPGPRAAKCLRKHDLAAAESDTDEELPVPSSPPKCSKKQKKLRKSETEASKRHLKQCLPEFQSCPEKSENCQANYAKEVSKYVANNFTFPTHKAEDVCNAVRNWFSNHKHDIVAET